MTCNFVLVKTIIRVYTGLLTHTIIDETISICAIMNINTYKVQNIFNLFMYMDSYI